MTMKTNRRDHQTKMKSQLNLWTARLEILRRKAEKAGAETKKDLLGKLADLQKLEASAREHLTTLEKTASTTWDKVRGEVSEKWHQVGGAVDSIWASVHPKTTSMKRKVPARRSQKARVA